jgi:hypothetical protein
MEERSVILAEVNIGMPREHGDPARHSYAFGRAGVGIGGIEPNRYELIDLRTRAIYTSVRRAAI